MTKKTLIKLSFIAISIFLFGLTVRSLFVVDLQFLIEERLIKKNYRKNKELFTSIKEIFIHYPPIEINFDKNNYLDITLRSKVLFETKDSYFFDSLYTLKQENPNILITDTSAFLFINSQPFIIEDFSISDSALMVQTIDSTFRLGNSWYLKYNGYQKTGLMPKILNLAKLDYQTIDQIKKSLRSINCFGYEKDNAGNVIINFRANSHMIDVFSYIITNGREDSINILKNTFPRYGRIESNIYWFHYERMLVSYSPYFKLTNRKI